MHHVVNEIDQREQCIYCCSSLKSKKWRTEHEIEHHYKVAECDCGKRIRIKVNYHGSGHDSWNKTIEDKVKK